MTVAWTLEPGKGIASMQQRELHAERPGAGEVRVALRAMSVNARDLMIAAGQSPLPVAESLIPLSDAAGVVDEVGEGVAGLEPGDRVVLTFNPAHRSGDYAPWMEASAFGGSRQGLLRSDVVVEEAAVVPIPDSISFEQAACLPCAGAVAWNAMFEIGGVVPGSTVVATGTGNVSLIAMGLARAAGARFGVTSSSEEKLQRARELGADFGVDYRTRPDWDAGVREATGGRGADVVLENAGPPSIACAVRAGARDGVVVQIGWKGLDGPPIDVLQLALGGVSIRPVMVGSRAMLERVVAAVGFNGIEVPIEASFAFDQATEALEAASGNTFGKVVVRHD